MSKHVPANEDVNNIYENSLPVSLSKARKNYIRSSRVCSLVLKLLRFFFFFIFYDCYVSATLYHTIRMNRISKERIGENTIYKDTMYRNCKIINHYQKVPEKLFPYFLLELGV